MEAIKRMKFWIALGLLVVASGVVLGVWFVPARKTSASLLSDWRSKEGRVKAYGPKMGDVRSSKDVDALRQLQGNYEQQFKQAGDLLTTWDKLLEDYIPGDDGSKVPLEGGIWKHVYDARMDALEEDAQASFPSTPDVIVKRRDFGDDWATDGDMRQEAKRYWVQFYLLKAIEKANEVNIVIPTLKDFRLVERPDRLLASDDASMFVPIPFEFQFSTEFENLPVVLHRLLQCEVPVAITTVSAKRRAKVSLAVQKKEGTTGGILSATAVNSLLGTARAGAGRAPGPGPGYPMWDGPFFREETGPPSQALMRRMEGRAGRGTERAPGRTGSQKAPGTRAAAAAVKRSAEEAEAGRLLVDVIVKGYVRDYVAPTEAEPADAAK